MADPKAQQPIEKKGGYSGSPTPVSKLPAAPPGPAPGAPASSEASKNDG